MSSINNPGSGGSGGGTVTSVAGGVGITNVPEPIVGAGSVNLDIDSLTLEALIAAGDEFAFVDISAAGTPIAQQRKATLADIKTALGVMPADCASSPELLCLGGRTTPNNDPIISTDGRGTIYGSSADPTTTIFTHGLTISAQTTPEYIGSVNRINANMTKWTGPNVLLAFSGDDAGVQLNDDPVFSMFNAVVIDRIFNPIFVIGDDSLGGPIFNPTAYTATVSNPPGVAKSLAQAFVGTGFTQEFTADGAACTITGIHSVYTSHERFHTPNGGSLSLPSIMEFDISPTMASGVTCPEHVAYQYGGIIPESGPATVAISTGFQCLDGDTVATDMYSFRSKGPVRRTSHAGPAVYGADAALSSVSVGLELLSTTLAFLPSRLTTTERDALTTPVNGMFIYNSTIDRHQAYQAGAWVSV